MPPNKCKRNLSSNDGKQPPTKKQKSNQKRILSIDQINSFEKHFYLQRFIGDISEE